MPYLERDSVRFHYIDKGVGLPFVFQHGLGGDLSQPCGFFLEGHDGIRLISMDCRAHGDTRPLGPLDKISMAAFADDVVALMDHLRVDAAVVGGISMGAAISLNLALRYPSRVLALILQRPAWLGSPLPDHLKPLVYIGQLIREHGAAAVLDIFKQSDVYERLLRESPDVAASALGQFTHPRAAETAIRLERITRDVPCEDRAWKSLNVPVLVLANRIDPIHPFEYGEVLAREIPNAEFREITPKSTSVEAHYADVRREILGFLKSLGHR
jgi:pimeloyl-ACP methyl ester carboxylesterase